MPDLLDRQDELDKGTPYTGWDTNLGAGDQDEPGTNMDDFENSLNEPSDGYDPTDPTSKAKRNDNAAIDGDRIQAEEAKVGQGTSKADLAPGEDTLNGRAFALGKDLASAVGPTAPTTFLTLSRRAFKSNKGKGAGIGGLLITCVLIFIAISSPSLDTEYYKSNFLTKANAAANRVIQRRRVTNILNKVSKLAKNTKERVARFFTGRRRALLSVWILLYGLC